MYDIPRILLTGGPCGGKTTALAHIVRWCTERGFTPLVVPEAATGLIDSGILKTNPVFQALVFRQILQGEDMRFAAAEAIREQNPVIIYDRGLFDIPAYIGKSAFLKLCEQEGVSEPYKLRGERYPNVIFLRSAAVGAEQYYTRSNNPARDEGLEDAKDIDKKTLAAWHGVEHIHVVENIPSQTFEEKMQRTIQALARSLGIPEPVEHERKFNLLEFVPESLPSDAVHIDIVQTYLVSKGNIEERVRARGQKNQWLFFHTTKERRGPGIAIEHDRMITRREYEGLLVRRCADRQEIHKTRSCFTYANQYCEVDQFHGHREGLALLEIELTDVAEHVTVPPFLGKHEEVTGETKYSNVNLAFLG